MPRLTLTVPLALLALLAPAVPAAACHSAPEVSGSRVAAVQQKRAVPKLTVTKRVTGLSNPWDVKSLGGGRMLVTERDSGHLLVVGKGGKRRVAFPSGKVWVAGETGLMSLEVDPSFATNRRFYTCSGWRTGSGHDVRVIAWRLNKSATKAQLVRTLVGGFPTSSGRHGGCRLLIARDGSLYVGTGDAATGTNPRDLDSLGGKTLRLDRTTGAPWPDNPFIDAENPRRRYVDTFGHRNVQGLAQRADGSVWSVEHGSFRDDEVNKLVPGGDYGWNPVPGYNEEVPMTDPSLPGPQIAAKWRSGTPTLATSGATWVRGKQWGALDGTLAVAALKASRVLFMTFTRSGKLTEVRAPAALRRFGRLRSISRADNGDLLITTDTDSRGGAVLRVSPS
jgi:glucose/arabinose dehydrogenase